jgi:hypothetical protein
MKFRTTLIAALLLALFGAYVYFFEFKKAEEEKKQEEEEKKVFSIDWEKLEGLEITNAHGTFLMEKREAEAEEGSPAGAQQTVWRITEPLQADADDSAINGMVSNLKGVKLEQVVTESAENLEPYGLKEPEIRIALQVAEGAEAPKPLLVGAKSPIGSNSYAVWEGEDKVLLLSTHLNPQFDKGLYDLRHKKLFAFKREDVERLRILRSGDPEMELAKEGDRWEILLPFRARASETAVDEILNKLTTLKAEKFVDEAPKDLADYGLDRPVWKIEAVLKPDQTKATLLIGSLHQVGGKGYLYAKREERPGVVSLGMDLIGTFAKDAEEFREKKVMSFKTWKVRKAELEGKGLDVTLEKRDGQKWWIVAPIEARADGTRMSALLGAVNRLEGVEFLEKPAGEEGLAEYGLADPLARVVLYEEKPASSEEEGEGVEGGEDAGYPVIGALLIGMKGHEGEDAYYATVDGEDTVYRVSGEFYEENFPEGVDALRSKKAIDFSQYLVTEIDARGPEGPVAMKRKEGLWKLQKPSSGDVEKEVVDKLLIEALGLEVDRFVAEVPEDLSAWGLEPAESELAFRNEDGGELGALLLSGQGPEGEEGLVYVKQREESWVGLIQADKKKAIMDKLIACVPEG